MHIFSGSSGVLKGIMDNPLRAYRIDVLDRCLVVEDDSIIRIDLEETLRSFGMKHVHGAPTLEAAVQIIATSEIRFAVLDYSVGGSNTVAMAESLTARGVPALFLTAYGTSVELPPSLAHLQVLSKPFSTELLVEAIRRELDNALPASDAPVSGRHCSV